MLECNDDDDNDDDFGNMWANADNWLAIFHRFVWRPIGVRLNIWSMDGAHRFYHRTATVHKPATKKSYAFIYFQQRPSEWTLMISYNYHDIE